MYQKCQKCLDITKKAWFFWNIWYHRGSRTLLVLIIRFNINIMDEEKKDVVVEGEEVVPATDMPATDVPADDTAPVEEETPAPE